MLEFHAQILSRMGEQQVIGVRPRVKPTPYFTLNEGVLPLFSWETSPRDQQLLDEPRDDIS